MLLSRMEGIAHEWAEVLDEALAWSFCEVRTAQELRCEGRLQGQTGVARESCTDDYGLFQHLRAASKLRGCLKR